MPRATSRVISQPSTVFETLQQADMNKEIIWICIVMACIIAVLIVLSLCYIAYEKWKKCQDLRNILKQPIHKPVQIKDEFK